MPHSHALLFPCIVSEQELRGFVEQEGGHWQAGHASRQGFIGNEETWIFVRGVDDQEQAIAQFSFEELAEAERAIGRRVVGALSVDHTRGPKGDASAKKVIEKMIAKWNGFHLDGGCATTTETPWVALRTHLRV
jgi:hypothetical protein